MKLSIDHAPTRSPARAGSPAPTATSRLLAALRLALGFTFLWAFLDKAFGWGYSTPSARAWIHGGSPTEGFLASVAVGPLRSPYHSIAGAWWADWLFMLGLLGIGVCLLLGVGLRVAAGAGSVLLLLMWLAEYPPARHTVTGALTASTNPLIDSHVVFALVVLVVAVARAGDTWGLGRWWSRQPIVSRHPWLQ